MMICVSPEFGAAYETSLLNFVIEHRVPVADLETIISDLRWTGQHIRGGIDQPYITLERVE